jgi:hypothetical protein
MKPEHKHGTKEPCLACFVEYVERNGGLPTAPMDLPERKTLEESVNDFNSVEIGTA